MCKIFLLRIYVVHTYKQNNHYSSKVSMTFEAYKVCNSNVLKIDYTPSKHNDVEFYEKAVLCDKKDHLKSKRKIYPFSIKTL